MAALVAGGALLLGGEAVLRARLGAPAARLQTAIYARPVAWADPERRSDPLPIGTLDGRPVEARIPLALDQFPDHLVQAVLAIEDQRFYRHHGLDLWRIGGAAVANVRSGRIAQGGSTITQQLAKNLFLNARRTPLRKLREAAMAVVLELRTSKEEILEAYLDEVYLGQDDTHPIYGIGAAARYYFGVDAEELTLAQSALLAGMIQAPNRYNPIRNPKTARDRRNVVLRAMADQGRLRAEDADRAARSRLGARAHPSLTLDGRYFVDAARAALPRSATARGTAIYTTLDPDLQRAAERAIREGLTRGLGRDAQAALVAIDPHTGEVLALVGGRDYGVSQFNRATEARRQPGSAFKPIVALAALGRDRGGAPRFTLASRLDDLPLTVWSGGTEWQPANYDGTFRGSVTLREALEASLNVPMARVGLDVGPERIAETARRLGIQSPMRPVPSLALGSSEVTLLELVRAYGVLAAGGWLAPTRMVWSEAPGVEPVPVADAAEAYLVTSALEGVVARGTGRALRDQVEERGDLAGKTGTSDDWRDAWFVAYSPKLVVGVWVGYDDGRSLGMTGAGAALPVVARFLQETESATWAGSFEIPAGIETAWVNGEEHGWWSGDCTREVFLEGTAPASDCLTRGFGEWFGVGGDRVGPESRHRTRSRSGLVNLLLRLLGEGNR